MNVTGSATTSLLESVLTAQATREEMNVELLKKAQDLHEEQGAAMVEMLERSVARQEGRLDVYA